MLFVQWPSLFGTDGVCCVQELLQQFVDAWKDCLFHSSRNPSSQVNDTYPFLGPINLQHEKAEVCGSIHQTDVCHLSYVKAFCQNRQENEFSWKAIWVSHDWGLRSSELARFYLCQLIRWVQELQRLPYLPELVRWMNSYTEQHSKREPDHTPCQKTYQCLWIGTTCRREASQHAASDSHDLIVAADRFPQRAVRWQQQDVLSCQSCQLSVTPSRGAGKL